MSQGAKFKELEETGETLVSLINSSDDYGLKHVRQEQQALLDKHKDTKKFLTEILEDMAQAEESASQRLLDMEEQKKQRQRELEDVEELLRQNTAKSQMTDSELQFLQRELETLRNAEQDLQNLQDEVDEETTEIIPSAVYVSQIYYIITKIKWEYDTPPNILKGVHYGAELATPINIDTSLQSPNNVSKQLWDFVSTDW